MHVTVQDAAATLDRYWTKYGGNEEWIPVQEVSTFIEFIQVNSRAEVNILFHFRI